MLNIKKIIVLCVFAIFFVVSVFTIAQKDYSKSNADIVKKIEISDYYGVTSLLVNLHLELGRWVTEDEWIFYVVELLNQMKHYSLFNIIDYLEYSFDIEKSLDSILLDISDILEKSTLASIEFSNNLTLLEQDRLSCDDDKKITDKNFSLALKDLDSKWMEINLDKSLDSAYCALESRIYYNVQEKILNQLNYYYKILEKKYTYFSVNRSDILIHYPEILYDLSK